MNREKMEIEVQGKYIRVLCWMLYTSYGFFSCRISSKEKWELHGLESHDTDGYGEREGETVTYIKKKKVYCLKSESRWYRSDKYNFESYFFVTDDDEMQEIKKESVYKTLCKFQEKEEKNGYRT